MKINLLSDCSLYPLNKEMSSQCFPFSCGDKDLDDFFNNDADNFDKQLLGTSYCFKMEKNPKIIVCAFTLANSSVDSRKLPGSRKKKLIERIPGEKRMKNYPAALIGRLGVNQDYRGQGIGSDLMSFIKQWITEPPNKCACRYLTVDAYNNPVTLRYYESNGFQMLFSTEEQEKEHIGLTKNDVLKTRIMFFDLIRLYE